ncbi:hypothetical protein HNP86_001893 [Methanococcus maripaludis]|uniref:PD-(D/E)XK endonuclease-like domain-containing protein n=1 Tax=Methanococcus maripaludis TaxID=39152 RepID=A0A7J9NWU7_METMI|nr:PD-(D/E)XK nuclease family protein [Methanococcus maripaludis]MBA2851734.1 hypothetical protein [Methanococcus maripaludis]
MLFGNEWLHKSHLKVYKDCPRKFLETYDQVVYKDKPSYALPLTLGTAFHEWAAYIVDNNVTDFSQIADYITVKPLDSMVSWFVEANQTLDAVWNKCEHYMQTDEFIRGTIDRIYKNAAGELTLVEYKTGNVTFSGAKIDFAYYTKLLEDNGHTVHKWELINPNKQKVYTKTVQRLEPSNDPLTKEEKMKGDEMKKVREMIYEIRNKPLDQFDHAKYVQYWCYDCPTKETCGKYCSYYSRGRQVIDEIKAEM